MKKLFLILVLSIFLISFVSASWEWDNVKYYNELNKEVIVRNALGLGVEIGKATLVSNTEYCLINCEAIVKVELYGDYDESALRNVETFKLDKITKEKIKGITIKVSDKEEEIIVPTYYEVCGKEFIEGIGEVNKCNKIQNGTTKQSQKVWEDYNSKVLKAGTYYFKIEGKKNPYQNVEWIPNIFGLKIEEWAAWNSSLTNNLIAYYNFSSTNEPINPTLNNLVVYAGAPELIANATSFPLTDGKSAFFDGTATESYTMPNGMGWNITGNISVFGWARKNAGVGGNRIISKGGLGFGFHNGGFLWVDGISTPDVQTIAGATPFNKWVFFAVIRNDTSTCIFVNGTSDGACTIKKVHSSNNSILVGSSTGGEDYAGWLDEIAFFNRTLSLTEINDAYNGGVGISYDIKGFVILNNPANGFIYGNNNITFNCSGETTAPTKIQNVSLYLDGKRNYTLEDGTDNFISLEISLNITEGLHNWSCQGYNDVFDYALPSNRTLTIDTTAPVVNITYPLNAIYITNYTFADLINITLNYSANDAGGGVQACWYYNGTSNVSLTCGTNVSIVLPYGNHTFLFYANDTVGNTGSANVTGTWGYKILQNLITYNNNSIVTATETFKVNISSNGDQIITANFIYNGTDYQADKIGTDNNMEFSNSITINTPGNVSFYWAFTYGLDNFNSPLFYQNVSNLTFGVCDGAYLKTRALNFTAYDEEDLSRVDPFNFYGTFYYWIGDGSAKQNISISNESVHEVNLCLGLNITYYIDAIIQYEKNESFIKRSHYLINDSINNITQNKELFFIKTFKSTSFIINLADEVQLTIPDAYITIERYYPGIDLFKVVEMGRTDTFGSTIGHFETETEDYRLLAEKNGRIIYTGETQKIFCKGSPCTISLQTMGGNGTTWEEFGDISNFAWTLDYINATSTWKLIYTDTSGSIGYGRLYVYYEAENTTAGKVTICNISSIQVADTLTCDVSGYEGQIYAAAYLSRSPEILVYLKSIIKSALKFLFGFEGLFMASIILLLLALVGLWNPAVGIILEIGGMILINVIGIVSLGAVFVWGIIIIGLIILWIIRA